nr:hypothetical protein [Propioniciclava coleopterorum]
MVAADEQPGRSGGLALLGHHRVDVAAAVGDLQVDEVPALADQRGPVGAIVGGHRHPGDPGAAPPRVADLDRARLGRVDGARRPDHDWSGGVGGRGCGGAAGAREQQRAQQAGGPKARSSSPHRLSH